MAQIAEHLPDLNQILDHVRQQRIELAALLDQVHVDLRAERAERPVHLEPGSGKVHHVRPGRVNVLAQQLVRDRVGRILRRLERMTQPEHVTRRLADHRRGGFRGSVQGFHPEPDLLNDALVQHERP